MSLTESIVEDAALIWRGERRFAPSLRRDRAVRLIPPSAYIDLSGLKVAAFASAHLALRAACGRLPGQRPLARVPVSDFFLLPP